MGAVFNRVTLDATGDTLLANAGQNAGDAGWQLTFAGTSWTGSVVLKQNTAPPGAAVSLSTVSYFNATTGALVSAGTAITSGGSFIVANTGLDLYAVYTHTSGTVQITLGAGSGQFGGVAVAAADVTAGTFGAYSGSTGTYAFPAAVTVATTLAVTGTSTLTGNVGVGTPSTADVALTVQSASLLTGTGQYGLFSNTSFSSAATAAGYGGWFRVRTQAASFTMTAGYAAYANGPSLGAASAITSQHGFYAANQGVSGVTNAYGVYIAAQSGALTTNIGLYNAGTTTLVGNVIFGASTVTVTAATGAVRSAGPLGGIGYATGAGGAQTQGAGSGKATGVTSNTITTAITMDGAALNLLTVVAFTFTNSSIAATDTVICTHESAGTSGAYTINAFPAAGSAVISVRNNTAGSLSEAIVIRVTVIKSVSA